MAVTRRPRALKIRQIQGADHRSPVTGQRVSTGGIVTKTTKDGFWMQEPKLHKGEHKASMAVFVHAPDAVERVRVGDDVRLEGTAQENCPPWATKHSLSETQIGEVENLNIVARDQKLPAAVDLPVVTSPAEMRDQWERFEGMRVTVPSGTAVGPVNKYGDFHLETEGMPVEVNARGVEGARAIAPGAEVSGASGVLTYRAGLFQVHASQVGEVSETQALEKQVTKLVGDERSVTIASYNVENLDATYERAHKTLRGRGDDDVGGGKFVRVAEDIVVGLKSPDVIALQEMQDSDGTELSKTTDARRTAEMLINHVISLGGPEYVYVERPPENGKDGGQPGGNIRVGFLARKDRVRVVEESVQRVGDGSESFDRTRKSLHAVFEFIGGPKGSEPKRFEVADNHFSSKSGSSATVGEQDQFDPAEAVRGEQAHIVAAHLEEAAALHPEHAVVVVGDFNDGLESEAVSAFTSRGFKHFADDIPEEERYSHAYRGHKSLIDHALVKNAKFEGEVVHRNALFKNAASDHDPVIVKVELFEDA